MLGLTMLGLGFLLGCGGSDQAAPDSVAVDLGPDPASIVPANAPIYLEGVVRPQGEQRDQLESLLSAILDNDDPSDVILGAIEDAVAPGEDFSYSESIDPWLGARVGGYIADLNSGGYGVADQAGAAGQYGGSGAQWVAAVAVTDIPAAIKALSTIGKDQPPDPAVKERQYRGVAYAIDTDNDVAYGFISDFLVVGTEPEFKTSVDVVVGGRPALAEADQYRDAVRDLDPNRLFTAYTSIDQLGKTELLSSAINPYFEKLAGRGETSVAEGLVVDNTIKFIATAPPGPGFEAPPTDLLADAPETSWLGFAVPTDKSNLRQLQPQFDEQLKQLRSQLDQLGVETPLKLDIDSTLRSTIGVDLSHDIAPWFNGLGFYLEGDSLLSLGGAFFTKTSDPEQSADTLDRIAAFLRARNPDSIESPGDADAGFSLRSAGSLTRIGVVQRDDLVLVGFGQAAPVEGYEPAGRLGDTDRFNQARDLLSDGIEPAFYFDFEGLSALVGSFSAASSGALDPNFQAALSRFDLMTLGWTASDQEVRYEIVISFQEGEEPTPENASPAIILP